MIYFPVFYRVYEMLLFFGRGITIFLCFGHTQNCSNNFYLDSSSSVMCFFFSYDAESIDGVVKSIELAEHEISSTEENLRSAEDVCFYRWLLY